MLPDTGQEAQVRWVCLQDAPPVPGISWGIRTLQPPPEQEHPQYGECPGLPGQSLPPLLSSDPHTHPTSTGGLDFDAILLRPSEGPAAQKPPLVVMPHGKSLPPSTCPHPGRVASPPLLPLPFAGGPHSVFTAGWMLYPAALCRMGFAVLLGEWCWGAQALPGGKAPTVGRGGERRGSDVASRRSELPRLAGLRPGWRGLPARQRGHAGRA